jgi:glycosyltransferase involved in cell wall biosynthesis
MQLPILDNFDIINLHWIARFLSLNNLFELSRLNKPLVWTLHDMRAFTGGCHYSADCDKFVSNCENCPQILSDKYSLTTKILQMQKEIFENSNIAVVTPSEWLASEARKSLIFKDKDIHVIPYGVDSSIFKPTDKTRAKKMLKLSEDTIVLTFGVMSHHEKRKGFQELIKAMEILKSKVSSIKIVALFFGANFSDEFPLDIVNIGLIEDDIKLSLIYSAADIFILPSLEDNLPNTILESLSCETPVVAFNTGGAKDIVNDNNGKVVPKGDIHALCDEVFELIKNKELRVKKGKNGRKLILEQYQLKHQAIAYMKLFEHLKQRQFNQKNLDVNINQELDCFVGKVVKELKVEDKKSLEFSRNYNKLYEQIINLRNCSQKYLLYGNGTIGKTIRALIPDKIVGYVDIADKNNPPKNLENMQYDKIIISVLGRENEIKAYLMNELNVSQNKIITLEI